MANYLLNDEKMFCDIADGIAIVINSDTGIYFGLNAFGTAVFENLLNGASTEDVLAALKELPGAPEDISERLDSFIGILLEQELIIEGQAESGVSAVVDAQAAKSCDFILEAKEYDDAQDLLMADPIHEIREDTGWKPEKDALETDKDITAAKEAKMQP